MKYLILLGALVGLLAGWVLLRPASQAQSVSPDLDTIHRYVRDEMSGSRIPGVAIAIVDEDRVIDVQGFGTDGRGHEITPETPFWIGSLGKSFTALAVMQLVEAGSIELDAPVQRYIPEFAVADANASGRITVRHLLNHTSGFSRADGLAPLLEERRQTLEAAVADLSTVGLNRPVGESLEYSNLNYVVLGLVVQRVSRQPWADRVQQSILAPLGMRQTFTTFEAAKQNGATALHQYWFGLPREVDPPYLEGLAPTGYLTASVSDMARYVSMYLRHGELDGARVLSPQGVEAMLRASTNEVDRPLLSTRFERSYGMGWFIGPLARPKTRAGIWARCHT
jgi:CubicO group peptidase (beta-lactamase class C family)